MVGDLNALDFLPFDAEDLGDVELVKVVWAISKLGLGELELNLVICSFSSLCFLLGFPFDTTLNSVSRSKSVPHSVLIVSIFAALHILYSSEIYNNNIMLCYLHAI